MPPHDPDGQQSRIVSPEGEPLERPKKVVTERGLRRKVEDQTWVPVIIKRTDETRRHPDDTLRTAIREGIEQLQRRVPSLALSSVAAGLIVSFSGMSVAVVTTALGDIQNPLTVRIATALVYPLGFILCVLSGAQLFTEHTATALYPVLDRRMPVSRLLRLWAIVLLGNLCGAAASSGLHLMVVDVVQAREGYIRIGHHLTQFGAVPLFFSSVLAGWLMALGAWLVLTSSQVFSQMACIFVVTFLIGLGGLHHSIAGSAEMFGAMVMTREFGAVDAIRFIILAVAGNLVGGGVFVALLNYAHIRQLQNVSVRDDTR